MMSRAELERARDAQVVQSNSLVRRARYSLSLTEQRLVLFLISKIRPGDEELPVIHFTIADFLRIVGLTDSGSVYADVRDTIQQLADKSFWLADGTKSYLCRWIERAQVDSCGEIIIYLCQDMRPFLLGLLGDFTAFELAFVLRFKSRYSLRMYEFLRSYKYNNLQDVFTLKMPVEELRDVLGTIHRDKRGNEVDRVFNRYVDFKRFCVEASLREINTLSDMSVGYEEVKRGRKVTDFIFRIGIKDSMSRLELRAQIEEELNIRLGEVPGQTMIDGMKGDQ